MSRRARYLAPLFLLLLAACTPEQETPGDPSGDPPVTPPATGKVYLELAPDSPRAALGFGMTDLPEFSLKINGTPYAPVQKDDNGRWYIDSPSGAITSAAIEWPGVRLPFGDYASTGTKIPYSQFVATIAEKMKPYPLYSDGATAEDGSLLFKDAFALVAVSITGNGAVKSVKVSSPDHVTVAARGLDFAVQNCMAADGKALSLPARVLVPVASGNFPNGLDLTVCGKDGRMVRHHLTLAKLLPGQTVSVSVAYLPAEELVYYEAFDNLVWGSDPAGILQGYAPDNTNPGVDGRTSETGFEDSETLVAAGVPGTGFITGNTWSASNTVSTAHAMTASWLNSRDLWGWKYLFRAQEYQGCISVGTGNASRGWVDTPVLSSLGASSSVKFSFRVIGRTSATSDMELTVLGSGSIFKVELDGISVYSSSGVSSYTLATSKVKGSWHTVSYFIKDASSSTYFQLRGSNSNSGTHGWWMDDLEVRKLASTSVSAGDISDIGDGLATGTYAFTLQFDPSADSGLNLYLPSGGMISGLSVDGTPVADARFGRVRWPQTSSALIAPGDIPSGAHRIAFTVESIDAGTTFSLSGPCNASGEPLYSISDETLTITDPQKRGTLRLLYWNIQNGMWGDQAASYANFRNWIKRYNPDICVWAEAQTNRKTGSSDAVSSSERYFPDGWATFAASYGHSYSALGGKRDNFPQEVTANVPITTVLKITDSNVSGKPVQHGAGYHRISASGHTLNIVTLHTWPQNYAPGTASSDQEASSAAHEGDYYREFEVNYILDKTVNNTSYAAQSDWIVLGDFNSRSRKDNWYYGYAADDTRLMCQDAMLGRSGLVDAVWEWYDGGFVPTTGGGVSRIDYIYMSPGLYSKVKDIRVVTDSWSHPVSAGISSYWYPSDHKPIIVDFVF